MDKTELKVMREKSKLVSKINELKTIISLDELMDINKLYDNRISIPIINAGLESYKDFLEGYVKSKYQKEYKMGIKYLKSTYIDKPKLKKLKYTSKSNKDGIYFKSNDG